jgi:hypothetical protein
VGAAFGSPPPCGRRSVLADKPVDEIVNLDAVLDALPGSPTSSDVYEATLPFSSDAVAAVAARRALGGGGGGGAQTQTATVTTDANTFEVVHDFDLENVAAASVTGTVLSVVADGETFGTGPTDILADINSIRRGYDDGGAVFPDSIASPNSPLGLWLVDDPYPSISAALPQLTHLIAGVTPRYLRVRIVVMDQDFNTYAGANHPTATYRIDVEYV